MTATKNLPGRGTSAPYDPPNLGDVALRQLAAEDVHAALRAARWRLVLPMVSYLVAFVLGGPLLVGIIGPWGVLAVLIGCALGAGRWADAIWVCPRCARPLGRSLTPERCGHCGQVLKPSAGAARRGESRQA